MLTKLVDMISDEGNGGLIDRRIAVQLANKHESRGELHDDLYNPVCEAHLVHGVVLRTKRELALDVFSKLLSLLS